MADSNPAPGAQPEQKPADANQNNGGAPKSSRRGIIIVVVVLLLLAGGFFYWRSTYSEDTDDAQINGHLIQISSRIAGQVTKIYVDENQQVSKGALIAELDPRDFQVAVENAEAGLATAKANAVAAKVNVPITSINTGNTLRSAGADVTGAHAGILQAQSQLAAAHAKVMSAQADSVKADADLERYKPLVAKDVISKQQFDAAVAAAASAKASVADAQASEQAAKEQINVAQQRESQSKASYATAESGPQQVEAQNARAQAAEAQVKEAQAQLDQANLNLAYTKIIAPANGIVTRKSLEINQNISVGQNLLTLVSLDDLWVTANFKETQLKHIAPNQKVEVEVDATGKTYTGQITQVGGATGSVLSLFPPENATGNYVKVVQRVPVRIDFTNLQSEDSGHQLRPGLSVEPKVTVKN